MKKHIKNLLVVAVIATCPALRANCDGDYAQCLSSVQDICANQEDPWECQQSEYWNCDAYYQECLMSQ